MNYWFVCDSNGVIAPHSQNVLPSEFDLPPNTQMLGPYTDAKMTATMQAAFANPQLYIAQNGQIVESPNANAIQLANAQQAKLTQLQQAFNASLLNGFTSSADGTSRTYAIDPVAMGKWTGALAVINSGKGSSTMTVKDFNGNKVTLTAAQFQQMAADGFTFFNNQEQHLWSLEDEVNAVTLTNQTLQQALAQLNAITF